MATLEELTRGAAVRGILPDGLVTISDVRWIGTVAVEVTYKDSHGRLGSRLGFLPQAVSTEDLQLDVGASIPKAGLLSVIKVKGRVPKAMNVKYDLDNLLALTRELA
jgi:hypothetical protein